MRALVVLSHPPLPEGSAAGRCAVALIRGLRDNGVEVRVVAADYGGGEPPPIEPDLPVRIVPVSVPPGWRSRLARYGAPATELARGSFADVVREMARDADVVYTDETHAVAAGHGLSLPVVSHVHCLARLDRDLRRAWTPEARIGLELLRAERRAARRSEHLVANSSQVADALRASGAREVTLMPLALDPAGYQPIDPVTPVAGLIGSAHWPPTANAVRRLVGSVWPAVRRRRPDATLRIAGRGMAPDAFPEAPAGPGVEWNGPVASAEGFFAELGMLLYPLGRGSGTKVKVLEAMAMGVPVVTTSHGAEGIEPTDGVLVADDDATLVDFTVTLLDDPEERRRRGSAAYEAFLSRHSPVPATAPLVELLERVAGG